MVERDNIGIYGKINSGKSSVMNLLTQQETSIVDSTPGTTADTKITVMELHGLGPVKIFDTAGIDETGELGEKKRVKVFKTLKESDLVLLVINPETTNFICEDKIINESRDLDKQIIVIFNEFSESIDEKVYITVEEKLPLIKFYPRVKISAVNESHRKLLMDFIVSNFQSEKIEIPLFPEVVKDKFYILNIPMDEETPSNRFLRPQAMAVEFITRNMGIPVCFRMDLNKARSLNPSIRDEEKKRFEKLLEVLKDKVELIITDSQAMDVMSKWCPDQIKMTTFSIMMINFVSKGKLNRFVNGIKSMEKLKKGDKILIVEACNHSRIAEDIGTVQIPAYINKFYPGVEVEFNFGREFQENSSLEKYSLMIHCGGCMISAQKLSARIRDLDALNIPYTNYGVFLSYIQGKEMLNKVSFPFE